MRVCKTLSLGSQCMHIQWAIGIWEILPVGRQFHAWNFWVVRYPKISDKRSDFSFSVFWGRKLQQTCLWLVAELQLPFSDKNSVSLPGNAMWDFWGVLWGALSVAWTCGRAGHRPLGAGSSGWCFASSVSVHALWWIPLGFIVVSKWLQSSFWSDSSAAWIQRTHSEIKFSFAD